MTVDISEPDTVVLILSKVGATAYRKNKPKYRPFITNLQDRLSEGGGQKTGDKISYSTRKFKHSEVRGIGCIIEKSTIRIAVVNLLWHKNQKGTDISEGDVNQASNIAKQTYKKLDKLSEKKVKDFIRGAKEDSDNEIFED